MNMRLRGEDITFGDPVCYVAGEGNSILHDKTVIFIGPCGHEGDPTAGMIDIMGIPEGQIDCKSAEAWQVCHHVNVEATVGTTYKVTGKFKAAGHWTAGMTYEEVE